MNKGKRISLVLGSLLEPVLVKCRETGMTPPALIRLAIARYLGVKEPEIKPGNPDIGDLSEKALEARWRKKQGDG